MVESHVRINLLQSIVGHVHTKSWQPKKPRIIEDRCQVGTKDQAMSESVGLSSKQDYIQGISPHRIAGSCG